MTVSDAAALADEPLAWRYELAHARVRLPDGQVGSWTDWRWHINETAPNAGEAMRNVTPLYARTPIPVAVSREALINVIETALTAWTQSFADDPNNHPRIATYIADALSLPAVAVSREEVARDCDWPSDQQFTFLDEPGAHDPCYVVMPGGAMLSLNHHATEGIDIARAKFIVVACNAALSNGLPLSPAQIQVIVTEAMQDTWNDICANTDCHPLDIKQLGRRQLEFHVGHWARQTGARVADAILSQLHDRAAGVGK